jgi:hypothetical protein
MTVGVKLDMGKGKLSFVCSSPSNPDRMMELGVALKCDSLKSGKFFPAVYLCQAEDQVSICKPPSDYLYEHIEKDKAPNG